MVRLVGYQPQYFPRLHYFARILDTDIYTISDYLQYVRKHAYRNPDGTTHRGVSYQAHTPIRTAQGTLLLDVPVRKGGEEGRQLMTEAQIDYGSPWREAHLRTIEHSYRKAPEFGRVFESLTMLFSREYQSLAAFTIATTLWGLAMLFDMPLSSEESLSVSSLNAALPLASFRLKRIVAMSETDIPAPRKEAGQDANDWIIAKCRAFGADEYYYGGTAAAAYTDFERMKAAGITMTQQHWTGADYPQQFPKLPFTPNLSVIDLLMNVSAPDARAILKTSHA
jgi:hypothetical protein